MLFQPPIPDRYQASSIADVADRIAQCKKILGKRLVVLGHHYQQDDVIAQADYVIDLGPEGGEGGGMIVAEGTPEHVATVQASHTGRFLGEKLSR